MAEDGDYELLPYKELEELRSELNAIKRNPLKGYEKADDLKSSIDNLNSSIQDLIKLFSNTEDELIKNFKKDSIEAHFERLSSQNEKLAKGILAVAKLVDSHLSKHETEPTSSPNNSNISSETLSQASSNTQNNDGLNNPNNGLSSPKGLPTEVPKLPDEPVNSPVPNLNDSSSAHPLNSSNLSAGSDVNSSVSPQTQAGALETQSLSAPSTNSLPPMDMDLPPPPKKSGILGIFK